MTIHQTPTIVAFSELDVLPGARARMHYRAPALLKLLKLRCDEQVSRAFALVELRIGDRLFLHLPGQPSFSLLTEVTDWDRMFDVIKFGMEITLTILNTTAEKQSFSCVWDALELREVDDWAERIRYERHPRSMSDYDRLLAGWPRADGASASLGDCDDEAPISQEIQARDAKAWLIPRLTPELATELLKRQHPHRRMLSQQRVKDLARAMTLGKYDWTNDALRFDREGLLVDGQHRLCAVVLSGVTVNDVFCMQVSDDEIKVLHVIAAPPPPQPMLHAHGRFAVDGTILVNHGIKSCQRVAAGQYYVELDVPLPTDEDCSLRFSEPTRRIEAINCILYASARLVTHTGLIFVNIRHAAHVIPWDLEVFRLSPSVAAPVPDASAAQVTGDLEDTLVLERCRCMRYGCEGRVKRGASYCTSCADKGCNIERHLE